MPINRYNRGFRGARRWLSVAVILTGLSASACATDAGGTTWRCSVANGKLSRQAFPVTPETRRITGSMTFHKADFGRWMPVAQVGFSDSAFPDSDCRCNGIKTKVFASYPDTIGVYLLADGEEVPLGRVPYENPVTFKIDLDMANKVTLEVGTGRETAVTAYPRHDQITLGCSSADVSYVIDAS